MSKKQAKSTPEIYAGLESSPQRQNICIVEDHNANFSLHNNRVALEKLESFNALIKDTIFKTWDGFNKFVEEGKQTILAYHENFFHENPPKNQDIMQTSIYVWNYIIKNAKTDMTTIIPVSASGRKSTIGLCEYRVIGEGEGQLKTPQAKACLKLLREIVATQGDAGYVTEEVLKQYVIEKASELKTRQDPWRIFQYYRPQLISEKLITRK